MCMLQSSPEEVCITAQMHNSSGYGFEKRCNGKYKAKGEGKATETKGTVLIHSAEQLENYAKTEEAKVEEIIKAVVDSGAKVIVSGGAIGEMALHFCERYKLMVLKISSNFELRRFCHTIGAVALLKLSQPKPDDLGYVDSVSVEEIGGVQAMCRDSRMVPGVAATEIELDQYAITKFAESFETIPRTPAENAGMNAMDIISRLYEKHASGNAKVGVDLAAKGGRGQKGEGGWAKLFCNQFMPSNLSRFFALKYAADAACITLRVGQIIMAKPVGGLKERATCKNG
ncbi:hypothetical protein SLEP1_g43181 [Rubroshorea leprosula]|uniref:T-complex protein 1 subunit theta n=1 Tax=Rubroshorea leprosula TaxID=152421 RepID=A0AAV5LD44_9ROSI|nr:hypothetical protein SLEP1_g43181 [Rubroshorea leprosula]